MWAINYFSWFGDSAAPLVVMLVSMIPIAELRVGLPLAVSVYHLPLWQSFVLAVLGNLIPVWFILKFFSLVSDWLIKKSKFFEKFFHWLFRRTRSKIIQQYEKYGLWALMIFVAIPLPMTGAWTGALAAWLFGLPPKKSFPFIALGVILAGLIVSLITTGVLGFLKWIL